MCGIAGLVSSVDPETARFAAQRMADGLRHRGPDDQGVEVVQSGPVVALAHRRLSVLDLQPTGHQPMRHAPSGDWLIFNGEIYNFREIRSELESAGEQFISTGDSEVVLRALVTLGPSALDRFKGMFALAYYRAGGRTLLLARDPLGIKPLYWSLQSGNLSFASEMKVIEGAADFVPRSVATLLAYGAVSGPSTIRQSVFELPAGEWLEFDVSVTPVQRKRSGRTWSVPPRLNETISFSDAARDLRQRLDRAVRRHLLSDVPVGIFLSSGVDSSAMAALAVQAQATAVRTFTVAVGESKEIDESEVARRTAATLGTQHTELHVTNSDLVGMVTKWLAHLDQPSSDGLNTYVLAQAVRAAGIVVAISGLGGDELFGGYASFRQLPVLARAGRLAALLPGTVRGKAAALLLASQALTQRQKFAELAGGPLDLDTLYLRRRRVLSDLDLKRLGLDVSELAPDVWPPTQQPFDGAARVRQLESSLYMANTLLRDSDVSSMASALELRVPLLDREVIDFAFTLPGRLLLPRNGENKPLLVEATRDLLPKEVSRGRKRGFSLPYANWMRGPLRSLWENNIQALVDSRCVDARGVRSIWAEFLADATNRAWSRAWSLGVLGSWLGSQLPRTGTSSRT